MTNNQYERLTELGLNPRPPLDLRQPSPERTAVRPNFQARQREGDEEPVVVFLEKQQR